MTTRRDFLMRTSLALAGGLILGDEALEAFARLTHVRKTFPSAAVGGQSFTVEIIGDDGSFERYVSVTLQAGQVVWMQDPSPAALHFESAIAGYIAQAVSP